MTPLNLRSLGLGMPRTYKEAFEMCIEYQLIDPLITAVFGNIRVDGMDVWQEISKREAAGKVIPYKPWYVKQFGLPRKKQYDL